MTDKCLNCGLEAITAGTKPRKYCSDTCRKRYKRTHDRVANGQQADKRTAQADKLTQTDKANGQVNEPHSCHTCSRLYYHAGLRCPVGSAGNMPTFIKQHNTLASCQEWAVRHAMHEEYAV